MPRKPITYRVRWEIDVEAISAIDAAQQARRLQLGPRTTAKVFDTWPLDAPSRARRIDLCATSADVVEPSDVIADVLAAFPGLGDGIASVSGADLVEFLTRKLRDLPDLASVVQEARQDARLKS